MFIYREALITTRTHILPKGNMQNIYRQKSSALPLELTWGLYQGFIRGGFRD